MRSSFTLRSKTPTAWPLHQFVDPGDHGVDSICRRATSPGKQFCNSVMLGTHAWNGLRRWYASAWHVAESLWLRTHGPANFGEPFAWTSLITEAPCDAESREPLELVRGDHCEFGLKDLQNGLPHFKPTGFMTASKGVKDQVQRRCSGNHIHQPLEGGRRTKLAQHWPAALCKAIINGLLDDLHSRTVMAAFHEVSNGEMDYGEGELGSLDFIYDEDDLSRNPVLPERVDNYELQRQENMEEAPNPPDLMELEADRKFKWLRIPRETRVAIRRLHHMIGHGSSSSMLQLLRTAGASSRSLWSSPPLFMWNMPEARAGQESPNCEGAQQDDFQPWDFCWLFWDSWCSRKSPHSFVSGVFGNLVPPSMVGCSWRRSKEPCLRWDALEWMVPAFWITSHLHLRSWGPQPWKGLRPTANPWSSSTNRWPGSTISNWTHWAPRWNFEGSAQRCHWRAPDHWRERHQDAHCRKHHSEELQGESSWLHSCPMGAWSIADRFHISHCWGSRELCLGSSIWDLGARGRVCEAAGDQASCQDELCKSWQQQANQSCLAAQSSAFERSLLTWRPCMLPSPQPMAWTCENCGKRRKIHILDHTCWSSNCCGRKFRSGLQQPLKSWWSRSLSWGLPENAKGKSMRETTRCHFQMICIFLISNKKMINRPTWSFHMSQVCPAQKVPVLPLRTLRAWIWALLLDWTYQLRCSPHLAWIWFYSRWSPQEDTNMSSGPMQQEAQPESERPPSSGVPTVPSTPAPLQVPQLGWMRPCEGLPMTLTVTIYDHQDRQPMHTFTSPRAWGTFQFHLNSNKMLKKSFDKIEDFLISWLIETLMFS